MDPILGAHKLVLGDACILLFLVYSGDSLAQTPCPVALGPTFDQLFQESMDPWIQSPWTLFLVRVSWSQRTLVLPVYSSASMAQTPCLGPYL